VGGKAGRGGVSLGTVDSMVTTKEGAGAGGTGGRRGRRAVGSDGAVTATGEPQAAGRGAKSVETAPRNSLSVGIGELRGGPTLLNPVLRNRKTDSRKMVLYKVHRREM